MKRYQTNANQRNVPGAVADREHVLQAQAKVAGAGVRQMQDLGPKAPNGGRIRPNRTPVAPAQSRPMPGDAGIAAMSVKERDGEP